MFLSHLFLQCLKYKTTEHKDLYETEKLIQSAMAQMCNLSVEDITRQRGEINHFFLFVIYSDIEKLSLASTGGKKKKKKSAKSS